MLWIGRFHDWAIYFLFAVVWKKSRFKHQEKTKTLLLIDFWKSTHLVSAVAIFKTDVILGSVKKLAHGIHF